MTPHRSRSALAWLVAALAVFALIVPSSVMATMPEANAPAAKNVNTANPDLLTSIKGVGEKTAAKIVAERAKNGDFASLEDVAARVKGVGVKTVERFRKAGWIATPSQGAKKGKKAKK